MKKKKITQYDKTPELWRAKAHCIIAANAILGVSEPPSGMSRQDWGMYNLVLAVEDIAKHMMKEEK